MHPTLVLNRLPSRLGVLLSGPPLPNSAPRAGKMAHWTKVLAAKLDTPNSIRTHKVEREDPFKLSSDFHTYTMTHVHVYILRKLQSQPALCSSADNMLVPQAVVCLPLWAEA